MKKLGFGAMRLPLTDTKDQRAIDQEQVNKMADYFQENGFVYVDTAYVYHGGMSEVAIRRAFAERHPRDSFILADKMPVAMVKSPDDYPRFFAEQQERCGVEYFDYYILHDVTRQVLSNAEKTGGFDYMKKLKVNGKARHIGISYHDTADLLDEMLMNHPEIEFVQLQINYADWDNEAIQSRPNYEVCIKHGKPVIVMEPIKGGALVNVPAEVEAQFKANNPTASAASWAVRYAASLESVFIVLSGMSNFEQMADNVSYMKDFVPLNDSERAVINRSMEIVKNMLAIPCTSCRYCVSYEPGCPKNIAIPEYFALYNNMKQYGMGWAQITGYRSLSMDYGVPADCIACGACEKHCPQHIAIIKCLEEAQILGKRPF